MFKLIHLGPKNLFATKGASPLGEVHQRNPDANN